MKSRVFNFKYSLEFAKRSFFRAANAVFGKIDSIASEEVTLHIVKSKCLPVLLCGLEVCPLNISDLRSVDIVANRFFMKLYNTNVINTVKLGQDYLHKQ